MQMSVSSTRVKGLVVGSLLGGLSLVAACAPPAAGPPPTTATTTTNVNYACGAVGPIIGPGGSSPLGAIGNQVTPVAVTLPLTATVGGTINVGVDVGNLNLAAAPNFLNLNAVGIPVSVAVAGASTPATLPSANNFVGNGASIDLAPMTTTRIATAGANTVTVGTITIVSGATGFVCTPVTTGASATVTV